MNGTRVVFSPFFFSPLLFLLLLFVLVASNIWWTSVARVYTLSCTRQRFTYRYVPAIVAITSPLMALHNVICRPAPFLSDLFAPIVYFSPSPLFIFSPLSFSLSLFPDAWFSTINPVISYRERGNRVSSIKRPSVDIWYFEMQSEMKDEVLKFGRYDKSLVNYVKKVINFYVHSSNIFIRWNKIFRNKIVAKCFTHISLFLIVNTEQWR